MIGLIGVRHDVSVKERELLSVPKWKLEEVLENAAEELEEVVIISTCNRTEIYISSPVIDEKKLNKVYAKLNWKQKDVNNTFFIEGDEAAEHLMEVICGFHSRILGEDQILGQVKDAFEVSIKNDCVKDELQRLFQTAITCGKEFRLKAELNKIPVSSSSIVVREARKRNVESFMIIGFGEIGELTSKYVLDGEFKELIIVVRDKSKVDIDNEKVKIVNFDERREYYKSVDCIISCTSSPHLVVRVEDLPQKNFLIFDLAVPRDVDERVVELGTVELYDIDTVSMLHDENHIKRRKLMSKNRNIIDKYLKSYFEWVKTKDILPYITSIQKVGQIVHSERYKSFKNKRNSKDGELLADILIKSTSDFYVNRAIEVLKEEHLKGRTEECVEIINRIFKI